MPSFRHEFLVELFRKRGELACELLRWAGIAFDHERVALGSVELSQVVSTAYYPDAVLELQDGSGDVVAAVVVEVQLWPDPAKKYTWPHYVAALRCKLKCPVVLLVVTPKPDVAAWARTPIPLGHPGFCLAPLVIEFDDVPPITDPVLAHRLPELAVLSALAHPELEVAKTAVGAISMLPEDQSRLYLDVVITALPPLIRQALEGRMEGYEYQSEFARRYYNQGRDEGLNQGREEGLNQGREEGLNQGREEGLRRAVLSLAHAKLDVVTIEEEAAIQAIRDEDMLETLNSALGSARSSVEARGILDRTIARHAVLSSLDA